MGWSTDIERSDEAEPMVRDEHTLERNGVDAEADDLAHAFAALLKELDRVRLESEATHRQLLQRNRELAAMAAVAQATSSGQLDLAGTLGRAYRRDPAGLLARMQLGKETIP